LRDAVVITAAQKVEHYEIASYGTVRTYAEVLGEPSVARLLAQTVKEEKADGKLSTIAERSLTRKGRKSGAPKTRKKASWRAQRHGSKTPSVRRPNNWPAAPGELPRRLASSTGAHVAGAHGVRLRANPRTRA
jgi:hypothetical protein